MSESTGETQWIQTDRKHIRNPTVTKSANENEVKSLLGNVDSYVTEHSLVLDELIDGGLIKARFSVNELREKNGLQALSSDKLRVVLLNDDDYVTAYQMLGGRYPDSTAVSSTDMEPILVRNDDGPKYLLVAGAYHELIHKHIDRKVRAYANDGDNTVSEFRRGGLRVSKFSKDEARNDYYGDLVNELGNFGVQKKLISELLDDPKFKDEAERRSQLLKKMGISKESTTAEITFQGIGKVKFKKANIHFDQEGKLEVNAMPFLAMQLVDDLTQRCGNVDGIPFEEALIRAKIDPRFQNKLRQALDEKFGGGFYSKLKNTPYDAYKVLDLILEIQKKN